MANLVKISELPLATSSDVTDEIVIVKDGVTARMKTGTGGGLDVDTVRGKKGGLLSGDLLILGTGDKAALGLGSAATLNAGSANGVATLGSDGKIPSTQVPQLVITDTFVVADETSMLALSTAEQGDIAIRTDNNKTFILQASPSSTLSNWKEIRVSVDPNTPTSDQKAALVGNDGSPSGSNPYATDSSLMPLESFKLYSATYTYALNEPCFYLGVPYKSLSAGNIGNTPSTSPLSWEVTGGGAGSGDAGYTFENGQFEASTVGWTTYDDGAVTIPVDGTGGSPTVTFARSATLPLVGTGSAVFSKGAADSLGEGVSYNFTIDRGLTGTPAQVKFLFETDTNYVSADMKLYIIETSTNTVITPNVVDIPTSYGVPQVFISNFFPIKDKTAYRLCWHVASVSALDYTMKIDDITVGSKETIVAPAISSEADYPLSLLKWGTTVGSFTKNWAKFSRLGEKLSILIDVLNNGVQSGGNLTLTLPNGWTTPLPVGTKIPGTIQSYPNNTTGRSAGFIVVDSPSTLVFWVIAVSDSTFNAAQIASATFGVATGTIAMDFSIPIAQFSVNTSFIGMNEPMYLSNSNQTITADDTGAGTVSGMDGALIPSFIAVHYRDITLPRALQPNETPVLQVRSKINGCWIDVENARITDSRNLSNGYHNASGLGIGIANVTTGASRIWFNVNATCKVSDGAVVSWPSLIAAADGFDRWRVRIGQAGLSEVKPSVIVQAKRASTQALTANVTNIICDTVGNNSFSAYSTSTGVFTAPMSGWYNISINGLGIVNTGIFTDFNLYKNGLVGDIIAKAYYNSGLSYGSGSAMAYLQAQETLSIRATSSFTLDAKISMFIFRIGD